MPTPAMNCRTAPASETVPAFGVRVGSDQANIDDPPVPGVTRTNGRPRFRVNDRSIRHDAPGRGGPFARCDETPLPAYLLEALHQAADGQTPAVNQDKEQQFKWQ